MRWGISRSESHRTTEAMEMTENELYVKQRRDARDQISKRRLAECCCCCMYVCMYPSVRPFEIDLGSDRDEIWAI